MRILAVDTSSLAASAALTEDGVLLGESYSNVRLTHSRTIMPMVQQLFVNTGSSLEQVDLFAVSTGPGSFTGLRIGLSAVKGMAFGLEKPCVAVSTLECLAENLAGVEGILCPVMDARCKQVYTALFSCEAGGVPTRLEEDMAIPLEELENLLARQNRPVFLVGDGAKLCYNEFNERLPGLYLAPMQLLHQRAASVAAVGAQLADRGEVLSAAQLIPTYLRLPQAERELLAKKLQQKG